MTTLDERRKKQKDAQSAKTAPVDTSNMLKGQTIYMITFAFAILAIGGLAYYLLVMDEEEDEGEVYYNIRVNGYFAQTEDDAILIESGGDAETLLKVENRGDTATYKVSYDEKPGNWSASADKDDRFKINDGTTRMFVLSLSAPKEEENGTYKIVVNISGNDRDLFYRTISFYFKVRSNDDDRISRAGDELGVQYTGMLTNGEVFDTSLKAVHENNDITKMPPSNPNDPNTGYNKGGERTDNPLEFTLNGGQMIQGFDEGSSGHQEGETFVIEVPPSKGYSSDSSHHLYGKTLIFVVTIVSLD